MRNYLRQNIRQHTDGDGSDPSSNPINVVSQPVPNTALSRLITRQTPSCRAKGEGRVETASDKEYLAPTDNVEPVSKSVQPHVSLGMISKCSYGRGIGSYA